MQADTNTMRVEGLLEDLCVKLGFCKPLGQLPAFVAAVPSGSDGFADLVLTMEGVDPSNHKALRRQVHTLVARHFASWRASGDASLGTLDNDRT